eukprot:1700311-Ditylum_brightwellii.AAC.1
MPFLPVLGLFHLGCFVDPISLEDLVQGSAIDHVRCTLWSLGAASKCKQFPWEFALGHACNMTCPSGLPFVKKGCDAVQAQGFQKMLGWYPFFQVWYLMTLHMALVHYAWNHLSLAESLSVRLHASAPWNKMARTSPV